MAGDSIIYGCSCCGRRCVLSPGEDIAHYSLELIVLVALRVQRSVLDSYIADESLAGRSIFRPAPQLEPNIAFYLHSEYLAPRVDGAESLNWRQWLSYFCPQCHRNLRAGREISAAHRKSPPLSVARGFDYGRLPRCGLPTLSLVEKLFLRQVMVYSHVVKLGNGRGQFALSGHLVSMPTTTAERVQSTARARSDGLVPRRNVDEFISITFVGSMDRWRRIVREDADGHAQLAACYGSLFRGTFQCIL